jgi:hypothetical protein
MTVRRGRPELRSWLVGQLDCVALRHKIQQFIELVARLLNAQGFHGSNVSRTVLRVK